MRTLFRFRRLGRICKVASLVGPQNVTLTRNVTLPQFTLIRNVPMTQIFKINPKCHTSFELINAKAHNEICFFINICHKEMSKKNISCVFYWIR